MKERKAKRQKESALGLRSTLTYTDSMYKLSSNISYARVELITANK